MSKNKTSAPTEAPKDLQYGRVEHEFRRVVGEILTAIDAAITDKTQNKALKDIIKNYVRKGLHNLQESASKGDWGHSIHFEDERGK